MKSSSSCSSRSAAAARPAPRRAPGRTRRSARLTRRSPSRLPTLSGAAPGRLASVFSRHRVRTLRRMRVGIMGLGYVGLPLAVAFAEEGHDIVGVDIDARKVEGLNRGESHIEDIDSERLRAVASRLEVTTRFSNLSRCDAVLVCVPTPLTPNREPDLGPLVSATRALADLLQRDQLVVLESTTYPGTTRERMAPILEESGLVAGPRLLPGLLARARRSRAAPTSPFATRRRSSPASPRPAPNAPRRCIARSATRSFASRAPRPPSSPSCSRTSSGRSTSPW